METEKGADAGMSRGVDGFEKFVKARFGGGNSLSSEAIINPTRETWDQPVTERVILTFTLPDYRYLCRLVQAEEHGHYIYNCALRQGHWKKQPITLTAPALGAPYAVMVMEKLIALGARMILALGWCGSLQPHLTIGDLVLPTATVSTEGTSWHYPLENQPPDPDQPLVRMLQSLLKNSDHRWQDGTVWSTDGFYRETVDLVQRFQSQGVLAVDMEMSALFTLGRFRQVPVAGLLVVSDELASLRWKTGYRCEHFRRARNRAAHLVLAAAAQWENGHA